MRLNVGIDVSKETLDLCLLLNQAKSGSKFKCLKNRKVDYLAINDWILKLSKCQPNDIVITMESTGVYHEAIALYLYTMGFQIFISNPGKAKKFSQALGLIHKTDKSDAYMLARYGAAQNEQINLWKPDDANTRNIKALTRRLSALEKDRLRENNRLEASEISDAHDRVLLSITRIIRIIEDEIQEIENEIDTIISACPTMKKNHDLLMSVIGIGKVMSRELVYLFSAKNFSTAKQAAAYVGLIPKLNESGSFKGRTTLSKIGPSRIRSKIFLAAVSAGTHNPGIKAQKNRLLAAGKTKMQALGAAMRKLIQICFGVIKNQTKYKSELA
ncbi:IS110 family transposase [Pseudoalteromonas nigrifaciens]|uniref:IS110 family transposase n=1 Tax=Pseudoalteromonas nigrifaciens TaxID=28109 RepID=UPI001787BFB1|nr:IS110 family transposase [Pseudoalteromonas nigrifaciens]MBE0420567.1 IS110 family transposase [Pseudoalteromonas nigrifaciens]